ncbi:unnamed protein product [Rhizophagus irregularis]|nr:unnamed protein product [Rhizophagus irregularis]
MWEYQLSLKIHVIVNNTFGTGEYLLNQLNMVQMLLFTVERNGLEVMEQQRCKLARWLESRDDILWVSYPGLEPYPHHENIKKYMRNRFGRIWLLVLKVSHLTYVEDAKTLVIHSSSTTHQQLMDEEQLSAGVNKKMIRLTRISVGYEHIDDIKEDFTIAFGKIKEIN